MTIITNFIHRYLSIGLFVFSIYDIDANGVIDSQEANIMNQEIYGKYYASSKDGQRYECIYI